MRAVAYLRVSTDDQNLGPEGQRAAIERWCATHGHEVVAWYEDHGVSGGAEVSDRPALLEAIAALEEYGAGLLVVAKRDRLARNAFNATVVERLVTKAHATVASADGAPTEDTPEARLLRGILDLFAEYELALIRARTRVALAVKKQRGERTGALPFGSTVADDGKTLLDDPEEAQAVERILALRDRGLGPRRIARKLTEEGVQPRGAAWHPTTIARVLRARGA